MLVKGAWLLSSLRHLASDVCVWSSSRVAKSHDETTVNDAGGGRIGNCRPDSSVNAMEGATGDTGDDRNDWGGVKSGEWV